MYVILNTTEEREVTTMATYYNVYYKVNGMSYICAKAVSKEEAEAVVKEWQALNIQAYMMGW